MKASALISEAECLEEKARILRDRALMVTKSCNHRWEATVYDPIVREGYHDAGDPPGTMGVDRRLPFDVPRTETPRWKRTCSVCGTTQETERKKMVTGALSHEVPDFGDR